MVTRFSFARKACLAALVLAGMAASGCQVQPRGFLDAITPETVAVGITDPNLINGPIATTRAGQSRRDAFGQIGVTVQATYRLKPIRIERSAVQPVTIVGATPAPSPNPSPNGHRQNQP